MRGRVRDGDTETETNLNSRLKSTLLWLKNHLIPFSPPISVIIKCLKHSKSHMYVAKPTKRKKTLVLFLFCSYFNCFLKIEPYLDITVWFLHI